MADKPIQMMIRGPVPVNILCPSCGISNAVPPKTTNSPMYSLTIVCVNCSKQIFLRIITV